MKHTQWQQGISVCLWAQYYIRLPLQTPQRLESLVSPVCEWNAADSMNHYTAGTGDA